MEGKKVILNLAIVAAVGIAVFFPGFSELEKLRDENEAVRQRIDMLKHQNALLRDEIRLMKENPDYVEQKAREKLGVVKKEEYIYDGSQKQAEPKATNTKSSTKPSSVKKNASD